MSGMDEKRRELIPEILKGGGEARVHPATWPALERHLRHVGIDRDLVSWTITPTVPEGEITVVAPYRGGWRMDTLTLPPLPDR